MSSDMSGNGSETDIMMSGSGNGDDGSSEVTGIVVASVVAAVAFLLVLVLACIVIVVMARRVKGRRGEWTVSVPGMDTEYKGKLELHEGVTNAMYACKLWDEERVMFECIHNFHCLR